MLTLGHRGAQARRVPGSNVAGRHARLSVTSRAARNGDGAACHRALLPVDENSLSRRSLLAALVAAPAVFGCKEALAIQGSTAGRIPGVSTTPDANGFYTYARPAGKSGGHGVGWSEIPIYSFKVPGGWRETPVSIADLGGTEIDLRFSNPEVGDLQVVVAPVLRFADVGFGANVHLEDLGSADQIIDGFAPELYGTPLSDGDVVDTKVVKDLEGLTYYYWELSRHRLVTATAVGNRLFLLAVEAVNSRQWAKHKDQLRAVQSSFRVPALGRSL